MRARTFVSNDNEIYNNTVVGGDVGIKVVTYSQGGSCRVSNNIFKNNIVVGAEHDAVRR